jgi:photosystem II stability/assembly factor-like uncharacterized protein
MMGGGVAALSCALAGCGTSPYRDVGELRPDQPIAAAAFRYFQRLSEDGTVPDNALMRAKEQRDQLLGEGLTDGGGVGPESWTWLGPGNIGGRIRAIVIHPQDPNVMWVGSASGGIWKTTNGGADWQPLDDFMASLSVGCMALHPDDPDLLYAGTGEGFFETVEGSTNTAAVRGAGIFKSMDGGATWTQLPSTANPDFYFVNRIAFSPADSDIMLAATGTGIWRSADGGATWTRRATFNALDVKFHPTDGMKAVAGGHHTEDGPYYSTDGGLTWALATGAGGHRQELSYALSNPNTVFAAVSDNDRIKIWRSTDGGQSYALMTSGNGIQTYASYNNTLWVDPTNPNFLILGGVWVYNSTNAGVSFSQRFTSVHPDFHVITASPGFNGGTNRIVFFGHDGGISRTTDVYGNTAVDLNNNLGITQFYGAAINPTTGDVAGGTQDNGSLSFDGDPQDWLHYFGGDGGYAAADPTDPNYFYGEVQYANIHRSTNGGQTANYIWNGITDAGSSNTNFIPYFMLDPNNPNRMLVACRRLWRSNNVKASTPAWAAIKSTIEGAGPDNPDDPGGGGAHFAGNSPFNISTIDIAPGNSDIVWVGYNNGEVWKTDNGTATQPSWTRVDQNGVGLPNRWISRIEIDPNDHDTIYVSIMGWEPDNLWKSDDAGGTWSDITGASNASLPEAPILCVTVHPDRRGVLYVGTDVGVFTSMNDGVSWATSTQGPGTVPVEELNWKTTNELMAVTHGRGIFLAQIELPAALAGFSFALGTHLSGGIPQLVASDNLRLRGRSQFGFTAFEANVLDMRITVVTNELQGTEIDLAIEGRLNTPNGACRLRLRNWNTGSFNLVHQYAIGTTEALEEVTGVAAANFVRQTDGAIELSVRPSALVTFSAQGFDAFFDLVEIVVR